MFGLVFEATVGEETLHGVDLLELDEQDRIRRLTVMARPLSALMALGSRSERPDPVADRHTDEQGLDIAPCLHALSVPAVSVDLVNMTVHGSKEHPR